jgi:nuclear pore complex protein Nup62
MDEIITRWATDLSTYQKEFQNQAAKVASWDRLLVENGDKIQKLYTSTFEAERASAEVERQLASVESQQDELTAWLDHYEREVDDMFAKQVGHGETLQGPDQERERTYKLAEKLTDRLDEMGRDLASMIQEINTVSATLTKTSKPDDPVSACPRKYLLLLLILFTKLSQIVRVLNGHLSQLQWIDQNAAALQAKIAAAQKASQSIGSNGYGATENDPADEFYRSYMGKR